jgi:2-polyprenyl-3-methyl-5-hydroxy-6-metoxy-1,4-benzoquinol methylase
MFESLQNGWNKFTTRLRENSLNYHRLNHLSGQVDLLTREMRLLIGQMTLPPADLWARGPTQPPVEPGPNTLQFSTGCRQESFEQPYFTYWLHRLGLGLTYHRKVWEHVFICQALWERGLLTSGFRGVGFGVGREPLAAYFASQGCDVLATDLAPENAESTGWSETQQHAAGLETVWFPHLCPRPDFDARVHFRACDMNAISDDIEGYDFCWSACALEHLGSIDAGLAFIERSVGCLKPGGWAIHTTEFNLSSNSHTLSTGGTVLFRRQDFETLAQRLTAQGHLVAPFDFDPGLAPLDRYIDVAPYRDTPHLKLALEGYATTSFGLIIQKGQGG